MPSPFAAPSRVVHSTNFCNIEKLTSQTFCAGVASQKRLHAEISDDHSDCDRTPPSSANPCMHNTAEGTADGSAAIAVDEHQRRMRQCEYDEDAK
ncbi:hypothetical protein M405DRAFT_858350 [Rhizopogon salebrosus TDB-379]|nr:hypothetical protein M405DRAFT_858350 [Rhizopogon salebrosus TDB-379]